MSTWNNLTGFVSRNKTAVIVGSTVIAVGAGASAYYLLSSSNNAIAEPESPVSKKKLTKDKKKQKKNKKKSGNNGSPSSTAATTGSSSSPFATAKDSAKAPEYPVINDFESLKDLSIEQRKELASMFKVAGNFAFNAKDNSRAIELYTSAIKCDDTDAIFYSNRAACYNALLQYENVIEDTTKALELKPDYIKCLSRRAVAYEKLEKFSDAVLDFTAACILGNFEDKNLNVAVDRVLRANAEKLSSEKYANKPKTLPAPNFITAYLRSFRPRILPESVKNADPESGDYQLKLMFEAIGQETQESYEQAMELLEKAIELGGENLALAYEYRGTFRFLMNDMDGANKDLTKSIELKASPQAYVKLSSIHMEQGALSSANTDFLLALELDPNSPDVYYHRAQIAFLTANFTNAVEDYKKSIELDDEFIFSHIQLAVTQYRMQSASTAIDMFQKLLARHPKEADVHNYYGEILLDQGDVQGAIKEFDTAISLEKNKKIGTVNVLPLINKSLAIYQRNQNVAEAESLCRRAVALDPMSDVAIGTLAQLCLQQNKTEEALEFFQRNAEIARTDAERIQALSYAEAARTQLRIIKERPALRRRLEQLTREGRA